MSLQGQMAQMIEESERRQEAKIERLQARVRELERMLEAKSTSTPASSGQVKPSSPGSQGKDTGTDRPTADQGNKTATAQASKNRASGSS